MQQSSVPMLNENDIDAPFFELGEAKDILRGKLQIANHCQDWSFTPENVMRRLRFLSVLSSPDKHLPSENEHGETAMCSKCAAYPQFADWGGISENQPQQPQQPQVLRLTNPGELESCNHYVAVSYCWQQSRVPPESKTPDPQFVIMEGNTLRMSRVSRDIIRRAIDFGRESDCRLIWIDQECIDQDDLQDKALHIQAMHLIFRRAQYVVAILNNGLADQWELDVLAQYNDAASLDHVSLTRVVELAQRLAGDIWHTRAWTYQEALLATRGIYMLIPCHPLARTSHSQLMIRDFDLVTNLEVAQRFSSPRQIHGHPTQIMELNQLSSALDVLRSALPSWKEQPLNVALDHHRLAAIDALRPLVERNITEPYDLIALCGNLCNYGIRLDANMVRGAGIGLSLALFALALLNGDMSLLLGYRSILRGRLTDHPRLSPSASLRDIITIPDRHELIDWSFESRYNCRISPPQLVSSGLLITGILWHIEHIDLTVVLQRYSQHREQVLKRDGQSTIVEDIINATCQFLREKRSLDLSHLANTLRSDRRQHLASQILAYDTIAVATSDDIHVSRCMLLPGVAHEYSRYERNSLDEFEGCTPLFGADKIEYLFTPYRILMEAETQDRTPGFLLAWAINSIRPSPDIIHIYSQKWPCKLKLDEVSLVGDARRFIARSPREGRSYWLHCF
jgi:hypothetical protein